ncbi:MAG: xanthine dehydrogenase family protein molybdopterin-binding subunit [Burkholderiaceae bacterium]
MVDPELGASLQSRGCARSPLRREDDALLQGHAQFVADLPKGSALHAAFVRSSHAHGRLLAVDAAAALSTPGVVAVFTASDLPRFDPLPVNPVCPAQPFPNPVLADGSVFYVGQPIAMVLGETPQAALAAAEQVSVQVQTLSPVVGIAQARQSAAIFPHWSSNCVYRQEWCSGEFEQAAEQAQAIVAVQVKTSRLAPTALEPRGLLAHWEDQTLTCYLPSQAPHRARQTLVRMLGMPAEQLHLVCPRVGGAFGGRASLYPEELAVAWAAARLGRSVFWQSSRGEDLVSASHGRASELKAWGAFSAQGRLLGLRAELAFDLGSWAPFSALIPGWNAGRILPGPYAVPVVEVRSEGFVTNTAAVGIYRGAGRPEAALVMERLMDEGARRLGLDPLEIRTRNLPAPSDHARSSAAEPADQGHRALQLLAQAAEHARYRALKSQIEQERAAGGCVGLGINLYVEPCGSGWESARITALPNGRFLIASGSSSQGQGHDTAFAQIAARALGVPIDQIDVIEADSRVAPEGIGALASRSMAIGGSAVLLAAQKLAGMLAQREVTASAPGSGGAAANASALEGLSVSEVYTTPAEAWSAGCCIAVVELDKATGDARLRRVVWVDDCGELINPLLARGQLEGGFAQGFGEVFCESIVYDENGQILTGSLMDYALPRADDLVTLEIAHLRHAEAAPPHKRPNPLNLSGVGESGAIAAPAALINAVADALCAQGTVGDIELPLKPETIWRMMQKKH